MSETEQFIRKTIQHEGWYWDFTLEPVSNGGNNQVYKLVANDESHLVKHYFYHPDDRRDRFASERAFYSYLEEADVHRMPRSQHWMLKERLAVFEFVDGRKPEEATPAMVQQALEFFSEMNAYRHSADAAALPAASEACFSLREHVETVAQRVNRLVQITPEAEIDGKAMDFVFNGIQPKWDDIAGEVIRSAAREGYAAPLSAGSRCLSPSDFGFHNSIFGRGGKLRFFDFEYAGWDDPVKTVCDFFCQPAVPVDHALLPEFTAKVEELFPDANITARVKALLPLYQIKWCCIMLNEFLPTSAARRRFAQGDDDETGRKTRQLERARALCDSIRKSGA
jgi:Phosphotransferase enzyme family